MGQGHMQYRLALRLSCRGHDFRMYVDVIFCYMKSNKLFAAEVPKDPDAAVADKDSILLDIRVTMYAMCRTACFSCTIQ